MQLAEALGRVSEHPLHGRARVPHRAVAVDDAHDVDGVEQQCLEPLVASARSASSVAFCSLMSLDVSATPSSTFTICSRSQCAPTRGWVTGYSEDTGTPVSTTVAYLRSSSSS